MWELESFEVVEWAPEGTSDFSGPLHRIVHDGEIIANIIEFIQWDYSDDVQLTICESCGMDGCEPGGHVKLRRAGDKVLLSEVLGRFHESETDVILRQVDAGERLTT